MKSGTLVHAKREFLNHNKYSAADGDSECALLRSGSGVAGLADAWIQATYQVMADAKLPIIPPSSPPDTPTALRWLKIHHPELLVSKPDEASVAPAAPVAVAPAPPVVAPEPKPSPPETVQKQPDTAPKKRVTVKANASKLLPKPLRNPKTHPELLADEAPHAKTAQKQPDTAPGDHDTAKTQKRAKRPRDPAKEPF